VTRIAIAPSRPVGRLDRKVFGGFVEHLGRCIYDGLYEEGSLLSDDRGFRKVAVEPGRRISFDLDPARLHFFDPDTGQAITG
jgi:alpha-L-arabinofuranosidase